MLGLDDIIGNFEVGKEFDALLIEPQIIRSKFVVVSNFDTVQVATFCDSHHYNSSNDVSPWPWPWQAAR